MSDTPLIPINALEGLMKKAFVENAMSAGLFWDALVKSNLYIPLSKEAMENVISDPEIDKLSEFPMVLGQNADGENVIWVFTSPKTMAEYTETNLRYLQMPAQTVFANLRDSEYEVYLIGPEGLTLNLDPKLIDQLADGKVPEPTEESLKHIPKDAKVYVGAVTEDSAALEEKFIQLFKTDENVIEGAFVQISDDAGPRLLLGLKLENESRPELQLVAEKIARAAEGVLAKGKTMDITLINGSLKEAFAKWGKSFYKK